MLNIDSKGRAVKLLTLIALDHLLFLELKNNYKHMVNSPQYIPGLQMLSPCHLQQGIVIIRSQSSADL